MEEGIVILIGLFIVMPVALLVVISLPRIFGEIKPGKHCILPKPTTSRPTNPPAASGGIK